MEKNIKKISDVSLEKVSGGEKIETDDVIGAGLITAAAACPLACGCSVASMVCQHKANAEQKRGNTIKAEKLSKAGRILTDVAVGIGGLEAAGFVTGMVLAAKTAKK